MASQLPEAGLMRDCPHQEYQPTFPEILMKCAQPRASGSRSECFMAD